MIPDIKNLPYTVRLEKLGLWSLEYRRIRADLIEVYKIIHGLSTVNFFTFFEYSDEHRTRGHSLKSQKHRSRFDLRQHFFSERIINVWNKLDGNTVTAPTLNCFKRHLETLHKDESVIYYTMSVCLTLEAKLVPVSSEPVPVSYFLARSGSGKWCGAIFRSLRRPTP